MFASIRALLAGLAILAVVPAALAQPAAVPPLIRIIVPFAPGASTDVMARAIASQLGPRLGTTVIVENRAGASSMLGTAAVAKGPKDGSQLLFTSQSTISAAATMKNVPLDVTTDLVPLSIMGEGPMVVVVSSKTDIRTPADLIAAARARPDQITHGTAGVGTLVHLAVELLNDAAGIQLRHIPYKGASLAVVDLASGNIDAMIAVNTTFAAQVQAGRARQIAVTSLQPSPAFPGLPTLASVVPGFSVDQWTGVFAPAGLPPALVQRLNRELNEIGRSKELTELMASDGATPVSLTLAELATRVRENHALWKRVAMAKNIVVD